MSTRTPVVRFRAIHLYSARLVKSEGSTSKEGRSRGQLSNDNAAGCKHRIDVLGELRDVLTQHLKPNLHLERPQISTGRGATFNRVLDPNELHDIGAPGAMSLVERPDPTTAHAVGFRQIAPLVIQ